MYRIRRDMKGCSRGHDALDAVYGGLDTAFAHADALRVLLVPVRWDFDGLAFARGDGLGLPAV